MPSTKNTQGKCRATEVGCTETVGAGLKVLGFMDFWTGLDDSRNCSFPGQNPTLLGTLCHTAPIRCYMQPGLQLIDENKSESVMTMECGVTKSDTCRRCLAFTASAPNVACTRILSWPCAPGSMASHTCGSFEKAERCRSPVKKQDPASTATVANTTLIYLPKTTFPKIRLSASMGGHYNSARITPVGLARMHAGYVTTPNFRAPLPHRGQNSLGPGDRKRTFCLHTSTAVPAIQIILQRVQIPKRPQQ